ncbi:peptidoglycan-associated lipoprotein Pal [Sphingomonas sp.]|uniref:peptidoglycan-associated lipoprotein Pal n=1 Tax=Sphingomonas sp. TaxID=28214 RepID=UPI001EB31828|nr:peptidoglycan-associated lipoprotein Pal [Sphingomonas sp.]MBX3595701.1 peptidoglycan-associated lipoprotein Pal [Sphingomonas sp.]
MAKLKTALIIATMAVAVAGCQKKRPETLPPGPGPVDPGPGPGPGGGMAQPGTPEHFRQNVISDTINFGFDQYDIDARARQILDSQAQWLMQFPNTRITIEGHCDERGTREYNLALGDRRANAAKNYLAARGVSPARITTISYGKERPIALGSDEASWAQNRRAVTIVLN